MKTVLIAHRDVSFAGALVKNLAGHGYRTITCPGPWPPALHCIRCDVGYCPLTEGAHMMIYDPDLVGTGADGRTCSLAVDSGRAHPDVPLLLAWPDNAEPDSVETILAQTPNAQRARRAEDELIEQVRALVGAPGGPIPAGQEKLADDRAPSS